MKNKKIMWNSLSKMIFARLSITIAIFTISMLVLFTLCKLFFSNFIWYQGNLFYELLRFISKNDIVFLAIVWVVGFVLIFLYYLYKSLKYIDVLIYASNELINDKDEWINLPKELDDVEKRMNEIKQRAIKNAKAALENEQKKNDLIVYLAHDIKTPLTSIIGYLSLLTDEEDISKNTQKKYMNITLEKAYRLENLINELFEIARYNSENIILEKEELNINLMIEQIADEFYPILKNQNKKIEFDTSKKITFNGDSNKLARVFNNIIKNAVTYSYEGSTISINLIQENNNVVINIKNKGKKIPESKLNKIFDKFYRLDYARTSETGGSGLGLAIAKDIVDLHGGKIGVLSNDEHTIFSIVLPL